MSSRTLKHALVALAAAACNRSFELPKPLGPPGPGTLYGKIVVARPGHSTRGPAVGAEVRILGSSVATVAGADGNFLLAGIIQPTGTVLVRYDSTGSGTFDRQKLVPLEDVGAGPGRQISLGEVAVAENAVISGRVRLSDRESSPTGHGGTLVFVPAGPYSATTADDGSFSLAELPEGPVTLAFSRDGYAAVTLEALALRGGEEVTLREHLLTPQQKSASGLVKGRLVLEPAPTDSVGGDVAAFDAAGKSYPATLVSDGTFTIAALPPGVLQLAASRTGYLSARVSNVLVTAGDVTDVGLVALVSGTDAKPCSAGAACQPDDVCRAGVEACVAGSAVCASGAPRAAGSSCGAGHVCGADASCVACAAGAVCVPENPCHAGALACDSGAPVCVDSGVPIAAGTVCGAGKVCAPDGTCGLCADGGGCVVDGTCNLGAVTCSTGVARCVSLGLSQPSGSACGDGHVCASDGSCVACIAGGACTPANHCRVGVVDCATGGQRCVDTGKAVTAGTTCGTARVCDPSGSCVSCVSGADCPPGDPCHVGAVDCTSGTPVCGDTGKLRAVSYPCGSGQVCAGSGACVACVAGATCQSATPCRVGVVACDTGATVCAATSTLVAAGTACGAGSVCDPSGACNACVSGAACAPTNPCHVGAVGCGTGAPVCADSGAAVAAGLSCGTNLVCSAAGACVACAQGAACTPTNPCLAGALDCSSGGPVCVASTTNIADGSACGTKLVCKSGACVTCDATVACTVPGSCKVGATSCATGAPVCSNTTVNAVDGAACGTNLVCKSGACVASGMTVVSGDGQSGIVGQLLSPVVFRLLDGTGAAIAGDQLTLTSTGGAVLATTNSKTDTQGKVTVSVRLGAVVGTDTITAKSSGGFSAAATLTASDAAPGTALTIANLEHSSSTDGDGGPALAAHLSSPRFVARASDGTLYVTDGTSNVVRRIGPDGVISTFAGMINQNGFSGDGGLATSAKLNTPGGLALDETAKILYVADWGNHRVRAIDLTSGTISTYVGSGTTGTGGDGGPAASAQLSSPGQISIGPDGALYIAEGGYERIRRVDPKTTQITAYLGGAPCAGQPVEPYSCNNDVLGCTFAWDASGALWWQAAMCGDLTPGYGYRGIGKRATDGTVTLIAGGKSMSGPASGVTLPGSSLPSPFQLFFDAVGDLYLVERDSHRVRVVDAGTSRVSILAGTGSAGWSGDYGPAPNAQLSSPTGAALTSDGSLVIAEQGSYVVRRIAKIVPASSPVATLAVTGGAGQTPLVGQLAGTALSVLIADAQGTPIVGAVVKFRSVDGGGAVYTPVALTNGAGIASTFVRVGLAVGRARFEASAVDLIGRSLNGSPANIDLTAKAPAAGTIFTALDADHLEPGSIDGVPGAATAAHIGKPRGVAVASDGTMYVTDPDRQLVYKLTPAGDATVIAGQQNQSGFSGDGGPATQAQLSAPTGIAVSLDAKTVYVADYGNNRVRAIDVGSGLISTFAGGGNGGDGGPAANANLLYLTLVSVGPDGSVYATQYANTPTPVHRIDPTGLMTAFTGQGCGGPVGIYKCYYEGNAGCSVAFDAAGNAYVNGPVCGTSISGSFEGVIKKDATTGAWSVFAGRSGGSTADGTTLLNSGWPTSAPQVIANSDGSFLFLETDGAGVVRRWDPTNNLVTIAGTRNSAGGGGDYGPSALALLNQPSMLVRVPGGHVAIADSYNSALRIIW